MASFCNLGPCSSCCYCFSVIPCYCPVTCRKLQEVTCITPDFQSIENINVDTLCFKYCNLNFGLSNSGKHASLVKRFDGQSVYWFGDIHGQCLSLCQGHSTTQLMQKIKLKKIYFTSIFNSIGCVLLGMVLQHVILFLVARTQSHFCTAVLFVCLGCDKMK